MQNNKSPGSDSLTKEFLVTFWDEVKDTFWNSYCKKHKKELSISKRQAIIKIIEKKDKDKDL